MTKETIAKIIEGSSIEELATLIHDLSEESNKLRTGSERFDKLRSRFKYTPAQWGHHAGYWNAQVPNNDDQALGRGITFEQAVDDL